MTISIEELLSNIWRNKALEAREYDGYDAWYYSMPDKLVKGIYDGSN